jgi:transcriptional/translational regulatory protein YebC/TACO1
MSTDGIDPDQVFEIAVDAGANDVNIEDDFIEIFAPVELYKEIGDRLKAARIKFDEAEIRMIPNNEVELEPDETVQALKVIEALEDLDDVQEVYSTLNITDEAMEQLEAV